MSKQPCEWFAKCKNEAVGVQSHPVLGDVPICAECQKWHDSMVPPF